MWDRKHGKNFIMFPNIQKPGITKLKTENETDFGVYVNITVS